MPFGLGIWEIVILVGVLALLFGAKGVPQVARRLGTGMREVKDAVAEVDPRRMLEAGDEPEKPKPAAPQKPAAGDEPPAA
jgi:sec-independent protein translocase protein TatA